MGFQLEDVIEKRNTASCMRFNGISPANAGSQAKANVSPKSLRLWMKTDTCIRSGISNCEQKKPKPTAEYRR